MLIRVRAIIVIFLTALIIVAFSVSVGILSFRSSVKNSQESDLILISDIADHFISSDIDSLKLKAAGTAEMLSMSESSQWPEILEGVNARHPEFIGSAVWSGSLNLVASSGEFPAPREAIGDGIIQRAFSGDCVITTIIDTTGGSAFFVAVPVPGPDGLVLVLTLPSTYFSELVSTYVVWETGHIFMDDADGRLISNPRREWVGSGVDFTRIADIDPSDVKRVSDIRQNNTGDPAIVRYSISDVPRLCAYRPVSGSQEGWLMGVVSPLPESPFRYTESGLIMVGLISLLLGLIAALIASGFIKKPFVEIAALKEEAETNSRFKSEFLANMSHEIRTPMNTVLGVTEMLMWDETNSPTVKESLGKVYASADLLLNIINDILDLSKIEAGKLELAPSNYELASLINDTATLNLIRIGSKEITFTLSVDENLPQTLFGDEVRIKQVLNNLLSNAFKYTEKGEVVLSFSALADKGNSSDSGESLDGGDNRSDFTLVISVSDTGQGMTPEQVAALFDQYTRFNYAANRTIEGTGLGMSITRNLIKLMDGEIAVSSEPGKGSVFTVQLPQSDPSPEVLGRELAKKLQSLRSEEIRMSRNVLIKYEPMPYGRVLVVDDVDSNLFVAKGLMMPYELSVDTVTSGAAAIELIKDGNVYDIVFMDHMMPKMDGIEATKIIRDLGYSHPIVALTANAVKGQQEVFLASGFDDFVSKPIDTRQLHYILKKLVRDKQSPEVIEAARQQSANQPETVNLPEAGSSSGEQQQLLIDPKLVSFFVQDAQNVAAMLETMQGKNGVFTEDDFLSYTIGVHAMKSALVYVGESELSAFAAKLEHAGQNRDSAVISAETSTFLGELRGIIEKFSPSKDECTDEAVTDDDYAVLLKGLQAVKEACGGYDRKAAKEIINESRQKTWPCKINELLATMSEYLLCGDFDEVSRAADNTIALVNK